MPSKRLASQTGNSCAAHCTAISIMELTNKTIVEATAEDVIWPKIIFKSDGSDTVEDLVSKKNSDPRRIVKYIEKNYAAELSAIIKFDDVEKTSALKYIKNDTMKFGMEGLYNMIKGGSAKTESIIPEEAVYYNCSYLMIDDGNPKNGDVEGLHNILVTRSGGIIHYYNSNEKTPCWTMNNNSWKLLKNANAGDYSYVFTGLCVAVAAK